MLVTGAIFHVRSLLFMFGVLAVIGAIYGLAMLTARRRRGAELDHRARGFRWWWVAAGVLGLMQAGMGIGQLIDDPKKENVFALVVFGAFAALIFGGMALRDRRTGNWMIATGALPMLPFIWIYFPPVLALVTIVMALSDNLRMSAQGPSALAHGA